jgi:hypothetical protein
MSNPHGFIPLLANEDFFGSTGTTGIDRGSRFFKTMLRRSHDRYYPTELKRPSPILLVEIYIEQQQRVIIRIAEGEEAGSPMVQGIPDMTDQDKEDVRLTLVEMVRLNLRHGTLNDTLAYRVKDLMGDDYRSLELLREVFGFDTAKVVLDEFINAILDNDIVIDRGLGIRERDLDEYFLNLWKLFLTIGLNIREDDSDEYYIWPIKDFIEERGWQSKLDMIDVLTRERDIARELLDTIVKNPKFKSDDLFQATHGQANARGRPRFTSGLPDNQFDEMYRAFRRLLGREGEGEGFTALDVIRVRDEYLRRQTDTSG